MVSLADSRSVTLQGSLCLSTVVDRDSHDDRFLKVPPFAGLRSNIGRDWMR